MTALAQRRCEACKPGTPPLTEEQVHELMPQVPGWTVGGGSLTRDEKVKNFKEALALVNRIGDVAEAENHHPDLCIHGWNRVKVELSTHSIGGLSENDFILAAKINELLPHS
jgi:4a-hydroxytetrahydrobiopterin dehydratase